MRAIADGKRYNGDKMEELAERTLYTYECNLSGWITLKRASDGTYWVESRANGQDLHVADYLQYVGNTPEAACQVIEKRNLDRISDEQEKRLVELKIIELVP
jgi:hypothetical protein